MNTIDFIIISQSEVVHYEEYNKMPLDRISLFKNLVQLRMIYYENGFRSHLDILNKALYDKYFYEGSYVERRKLLSIWNMPGLNGFLATSALIKEGFDVKIINNFDAEFDLLEDYSNRMNPPVIGISTTFILQWSEIGRIAKKIHQTISSDAILILGGAFINDQFISKGAKSFEKPMKKYNIKYAIFSFNSENDILKLMKSIKKSPDNISSVNNLAYLDSTNSFKVTDQVWNDPMLSLFPWDKIDGLDYGQILQIRTSSGCPFNCAFCSYPSTAKGYQYLSAEEVKKELDSASKLKQIKSLVFVDDTFNVPPKRFKSIVDYLKEYSFKWYSFCRVQFLDEELVKNMKESGCDGLYLGLESANDTVLKNMNKKVRVADYRRGVELLHKYKIPIFAVFIIGFPGENAKTITDNINFIEQTSIDFFSIKEFYYLHNTPVYHKRNQFKLEGEGYQWKHGTMTSTEASEMKMFMFKKINNSIYVDSDMGMWYLIYLRENGFNWEEIKAFQKILIQMVHKDNIGDYYNKKFLFNKLSNIIKTNSLYND